MLTSFGVFAKGKLHCDVTLGSNGNKIVLKETEKNVMSGVLGKYYFNVITDTYKDILTGKTESYVTLRMENDETKETFSSTAIAPSKPEDVSFIRYTSRFETVDVRCKLFAR